MKTQRLTILPPSILEEDNWKELKEHTDARIALGHTGASLPTQEMLRFSLAHASARDSVHMPFEKENIKQQVENLSLGCVEVHSQASNRQEYLKRPDLGRLLSSDSREVLRSLGQPENDITLVIADGLSSKAVHKNAIPMLKHLIPYLEQLHFKVAPIVVSKQSRVALGDEIGEILNSQFVAMLIGERPGLTTPDSLSIYLTYMPRLGKLESERNCISNIHPEGLSYEKAAFKLAWLMEHASLKKCTGIDIKDNSDDSSTYLEVKPIQKIEQ